jgi:lipopolysaccharide transport system permease protein
MNLSNQNSVKPEQSAIGAASGKHNAGADSWPSGMAQLPETPLVTIEPSPARVALNLGVFWVYRELLYFLIWRDIKVRYKQSVLGVAWAILQPLCMMMIFTYCFGKLARIPTDGVPAPLFFFVGIVPWTFFSNALNSSSNSLIANSNLITKIYFPRLIVPVAAVGAGLLDLAIALSLLLVLLPVYHMALTWRVVMLPVLIFLTTLLASAVGIWLSALSVKYRDVRHALPFIIQLWMFASPIFYPLSLVPAKYRWWTIVLNPFAAIVEGYRASLFGRHFDWSALAVSTAVIVVLLLYFSHIFRQMEKTFADVI